MSARDRPPVRTRECGIGLAAFVQVLTESLVEARGAQRILPLDEIDRPPNEVPQLGVPLPFGSRARLPTREDRRGRRARARRRPGPTPRARAPARRARALPPGRTRSPPRRRLRSRRRARPLHDPPPPSGVRAPPREPPHCARASPPGARAAPRARRGGSSSRSPRPAARGGSGSCPSVARRPGRPARRLGGASRAARPREVRGRSEQGVSDVTTGRRSQSQHLLGCVVDVADALQEEIPEAARDLAAVGRRSGEKLLGEEGVALGPGRDRVHDRGRQRAGSSAEEVCQLVAFERAELEDERRARPPSALSEPPHALPRRELVGAVGREQEHRLVVEVVREKDDEIQRRYVRPVQILEHNQHRRLGGPVAEQLQRPCECALLRAGRLPVPRQSVAERPQRLHERLVGQLRADEIDRVSEQDIEARLTCPSPELGGEPGLADPCLSGEEDGGAAPGARRSERALELHELACASDEHIARAGHHPDQYCAPPPRRGVPS